jgi:cytoskeletal protein CcmA (bactofilin family)
MISKGKDSSMTNTRKVDTVIGKESSFKGNLEAPAGSIRIDGYFEGELHIGGDLIVGESGVVVGNIVAKNVIIAGEIKGTIESRGKMELAPTAKVIGDSTMLTLIVEDGAFLQGMCSPLPKGDIKERGKALRVDTIEQVAAGKLKTP